MFGLKKCLSYKQNISLKPVSLKQGIQKSGWSIKDGRIIPFQL